MMRVKIFTCNSFEKLHPRIEMQVGILTRNGYRVEVVRAATRKDGKLRHLLNLFHLRYFRWGAIRSFRKELDECDIAHIYDFQLLPLAKWAKRKGKKVVYETLDDNVYLHFYEVQRLIRWIAPLKRFITRRFEKKEFSLTRKYTDAVIVNSGNLVPKFPSSKTTLIYYSSNLEGIANEPFSAQKSPRFLYVGKLTVDKGSREYFELTRKYQVPLIFYGHIGDPESRQLFDGHPLIEKRGSLGSEDLKKALQKDMETYNLIGLSIIHPINESYALQEANKDIDYIVMQIPFVGNKRKPTLEKIESGAGVLIDDDIRLSELLANANGLYDGIRSRDAVLRASFSRSRFEEQLLAVYAAVQHG